MARPKGRTKTARLTVNLDEASYARLLAVSVRDDVPVAQVVRKAVAAYLRHDETGGGQETLPLRRRHRAPGGETG